MLTLGLFSQEVDPNSSVWANRMQRYLETAPWAIVGEIGLDRNTLHKGFFESHQLPVFRTQLRIAAQLQRPVSVHSVKADGAIMKASA